MTDQKFALLSVYDKNGVVDFARGLSERGYTLLSTSGTLKTLRDAGLEVVSIADYTKQVEILDGRVKTLHPLIHAGLLARRSDVNHMEELDRQNIAPIDVLVINLYPFISQLHDKRAALGISSSPAFGEDVPMSEMIELIDIGGPAMLRSGAKNFESVIPVIDPADYARILAEMDSAIGVPYLTKLRLAHKVFRHLANYNLQIAKYFSAFDESEETEGVVLEREQDLRYGENPHQRATFYRELGADSTQKGWVQLQGKELSYNNLLDLDAAVGLIRSLAGTVTSTASNSASGNEQVAVAILKHLNPCGVAIASSVDEAFKRAQAGDPRSHFGGIVGVQGEVTASLAAVISESFYELVVAPSYSAEALEIFAKKKHLRVLTVSMEPRGSQRELRSIEGGILIQESDAMPLKLSADQTVSLRKPTSVELSDLTLAWVICRQVKSNAIVIVKNGEAIGIGAGQMSRVDSAELAIERARKHGHSLLGAVAASDAFFPFEDGLEILAAGGVSAIVAPGGAKRDAEVIAKASELDVSLIFASTRHFKH